MKYKYTITVNYSNGKQNIIKCKSLPQLNKILHDTFGIPWSVLSNYKNFSNGTTYKWGWGNCYTIIIYREELCCLSH